MKKYKSFFLGLFAGTMIMLFVSYLYFTPKIYTSKYYSDTWDNTEACKVVTNLDYIDSVANKINIENHVHLDVADRWETLSDREKINALLYNYSYEEILTVRKHPDYTHRDILDARKKENDTIMNQ